MRNKRLWNIVRGTAVGIAVFSLGAQPSWAWGRAGHKLTALVAERFLTPEAKVQIEELLGRQSIADIASWADDYRTSHPETAPWHYVDIPKSATKFDRNRDCPVSASNPSSPWRDCLTDRILYFEGRLGDESLSRDERAMALKFLVHFIGDVHQPFHALGDDRGGNGISVYFLGNQHCGSYTCNLHGVWDESMIEQRGLSDAKYTELLMSEIAANHWDTLAGGSPTVWADQSHQYAVRALAPNGALLKHDYYDEEIKVVDSQLALGGLRLAHVLNRILVAREMPGRVPLPKPAPPSQQ